MRSDDQKSARRQSVKDVWESLALDFFPVIGQEVVSQKNDMKALVGRIGEKAVKLPSDALL